ncbi:DNA-directed DNA polymerase [Powellomyces hirtus]|uniref:DNA-directed DNA polymerase n=1 Tax=Powellomyces hirtus TaxID=109895 RepID=A0A507DN51_9FUNG|nr:DNA-directed DNA polymerase [Powellomyces hirtus]
MLGYSSHSKEYRLMDIQTKKILFSRSVKFDEKSFIPSLQSAQTPQVPAESLEVGIGPEMKLQDVSDDSEDTIDDLVDTDMSKEEENMQERTPELQNLLQPPKESGKPPGDYKQSQNMPDAPQRCPAVQGEMDAFAKNGTWKLVDLPAGREAIGCKWVFKQKLKDTGELDRQGLDYQETFAPVAKFGPMRLLFSIIATDDLEAHQMDVKTAFLQRDLDYVTYLHQTEGVEDSKHPEQSLLYVDDLIVAPSSKEVLEEVKKEFK